MLKVQKSLPTQGSRNRLELSGSQMLDADMNQVHSWSTNEIQVERTCGHEAHRIFQSFSVL